MKDLTRGSISKHLINMAFVTSAGMTVQTVYYLVDLYFVSSLGAQAVAGVSAAGNIVFIVMALTQVLGLTTATLISHATGQDDRQNANRVFNQALLLSLLFMCGTLVLGYAFSRQYMDLLSADQNVAEIGTIYLFWYLPGMGLQFIFIAKASALRGTGVVKPTTYVQIFSLLLNIILSPVLILGWGTGIALGAAGAAIASSVSALVATIALLLYFARFERYLTIDFSKSSLQYNIWKKLINIGVPGGGEFVTIFIVHAVIYWCLQPFGPDAQAGYGIGSKVLQSIFVPALAIAFSVTPIAGQNFGSEQHDRVQSTFKIALLQSSFVMLLLTLICQWHPELLIKIFTSSTEVLDVATTFLRIMSLNFVGIGVIFVCSGMFMALGNGWPVLQSSFARMLFYSSIAIWLASHLDTSITYYWYLAVLSLIAQAALSYFLLRREFRKRLISF